MFFRKIESRIVNHLKSGSDKILLVDGARQVGKSFIIRHACSTLYKNYIEINLYQDQMGPRLFADISDIDSFYLKLSIAAEGRLGTRENTIVFLDEIQIYPDLLALLKFLRTDNRFTYIASGSMLGIALKKGISIPMGSIEQIRMYPMDFEEFLYANKISRDVVQKVKDHFDGRKSLPSGVHEKMLTLFKHYLISGGLPDAVKAFVLDRNIPKTRSIQLEIHDFYASDAAQYDIDNNLKIRAVYNVIPSRMANRKKRIIAKEIEGKKGARYAEYKDEFEYLTASGIALDVHAVPSPSFPLIESLEKNLLKLYLNDPGILTAILYGNSIDSILRDNRSINLGSVYESAVAGELKAHGYALYYYDNKKKGEVDFLIDDFENQTVLPIEIKSGKDYHMHASLDIFVSNEDYNIKTAYVFSNDSEIRTEGKIIYCPIYMCMFLSPCNDENAQIETIKISEDDW